ncbi:MAG: 4-hydroxy-3-methylbut-2-enyl diphosphate reductase, partial [Bacteroidia bacterium]
TLAIEAELKKIGIEPTHYNTTCPFVERVWKKSAQLGEGQYTIIIHGKPKHEETRATFSHSEVHSASIVVKDMSEAIVLGEFMLGKRTRADFDAHFVGRTSEGFDVEKDLVRVGVINQTTMLASDTQAIADYFKTVMQEKYNAEEEKSHFADTRDTLCYATNENQQATFGLLETDADLALVVGGYNSSNTSHLVELCERKFPTYFIKDETEILNSNCIRHFDLHTHALRETENWIPQLDRPLRVIITSGASCPDSVLERVLQRVLGEFPNRKTEDVIFEEVEVALKSI